LHSTYTHPLALLKNSWSSFECDDAHHFRDTHPHPHPRAHPQPTAHGPNTRVTDCGGARSRHHEPIQRIIAARYVCQMSIVRCWFLTTSRAGIRCRFQSYTAAARVEPPNAAPTAWHSKLTIVQPTAARCHFVRGRARQHGRVPFKVPCSTQCRGRGGEWGHKARSKRVYAFYDIIKMMGRRAGGERCMRCPLWRRIALVSLLSE
jgi:hypothetical protein